MYFSHYFCKVAILISIFYYFRWFTIIRHYLHQTHNRIETNNGEKIFFKTTKIFHYSFYLFFYVGTNSK
jgi:hypothetical protein